MKKIKEVAQPPVFDGRAQSKITTMGNIIEVVTMQKPSGGCPCRKLDKDHYIDLRTGEMHEYRHIEHRAESCESIRKTLNRIRELINTNVTDPQCCRWLTFTYSENMTDKERLYKDYFKFWKRFKYWCEKKGIKQPEYITIQEPQGRGAWHVHAFFIWQEKAPFLPNEEIARLWGHGFTKTKALQDCDNVGAYFSAYLGDMPLDEVEKLPEAEKTLAMEQHQMVLKTFTNEQELTKEKKFVKGGRLFLYPPGMNIVRKTKGIKEPIIERMNYFDIKEKVSAATETFSRTYAIVDEAGEPLNYIHKAYYNSKRK